MQNIENYNEIIENNQLAITQLENECRELTDDIYEISELLIRIMSLYGLVKEQINLGDTSDFINAINNIDNLNDFSLKDNDALIGNGADIINNGSAGIIYRLTNNNTEYEVIGYNGMETQIEIASICNGKAVTAIDVGAFENCLSLTKVTIPNTIRAIQSNAFLNCNSITNIVIPNTITYIGDYAFGGWDEQQTIYCEAKSEPNNWEEDWDRGCYATVVWEYSDVDEIFGTEGLQYTLTDSDTKYTVSGYTGSATNVVIPSLYRGKTVSSIDAKAFYNQKLLKSIEIPNNITSVGSQAFSYCTSLTKVNYLGTIDEWVEIEFVDGHSNPSHYAENLYIKDELVTDVVLTTATKIGKFVFTNNSSLISIDIPASVTSIGYDAFYICNSLTNIVIPANVVSMGNYVFFNCDALTTIYCEAESQPSGWDDNWNYACDAEVIWGYTG